MAPSGEKSKKVDLSGFGNDVTNVYAKFRNFPLRINKALGIFRKGNNKNKKNNRRSA